MIVLMSLLHFLIADIYCYRRWVATMSRPFEVRYNPHTQRVEILDSVDRLDNLVSQMNLEMLHLTTALTKLKATFG